MQAEDELDEMLLIAAWNKRQSIEAQKTSALMTAIVNPEKAYDAYTSLMKIMFPDYGRIRTAQDRRMIETFEREKENVFIIESSAHGFSAKEQSVNADI